MSETIIYLVLAVVFVSIGAYIGFLIARLKNKSETGILKEQLAQAIKQEEKSNKVEERFSEAFENLAHKIFEDRSEKFIEKNRQNLDGILKPLKNQIEKFESRVEETNKESYGRHAELRQQIRSLSELNIKISKDADNLTKALKGDPKIQGNWGEMILIRVLEMSGLEKGREFTIQDSHINSEGKRQQTDVIIHLPDGKKMIIDSKVSLTFFERFVSEDDEDEKKIHLKKHIDSIKRHIVQLSEKKYHYLLDQSPDTVFMFVPNEPAFAIAAAHQTNLYEEAFKRQVLIVTPSTLLMALRLVENLWENDNQKRNTLEIATQAGRLVDQFANLLIELEKINRQMGTLQGSFDLALKKLKGKGNLITKVERLNKLGAIASKEKVAKLNQYIEKDEEEEEE